MGRLKQFDPDAAVSAAVDLFWRQGYGATTPAALVAALGIGKGSLYNAFASKHALFERALRRYGDDRVAGLLAVLNRPGPVRARLQAALERLAAPEPGPQRRRGCLAVNTAAELGDRDADVTAIVRDIFKRIEHALRATIEEGQRSGEIAAERDAQALATLLLATILGMTVIAKTDARPEGLRRIVRAVMTVV